MVHCHQPSAISHDGLPDMLLSPYRVLDLSGPLGFLTGRILGDLGADVIKVEPPGGDPSRAWPPCLERGGERRGLFWLTFNTNKRGVTIDLDTAGGQFVVRELARTADVLIESFTPGHLQARGLGYADLYRENPRLIVVSVTPYGQVGPGARDPASDLEIMAASGAMSLAGDEGGEPMRVTLPQAAMWAGAEAAMGALTALVYRTTTGHGQWVDVSAQSAVLAALAHAPVFWDMNGVNPERAGVYITGRSVTGARMRAFWPCRDGWLNFIVYGGAAGRHTNQQLVAWMEERGTGSPVLQAIDWKTFTVTGLTQAEVDAIEAPIGAFLATLTKQEFLEGAAARQMLGYPVSNAEDIHRDPQLDHRAFWQTVADPSGRTIRFPGGFAIVDGLRLPIRRPAPEIGQHNEEVYGHLGSLKSEV
jgi:crotonobetainyl-CoA:carnitine CoA-transferase CaiB-like acyl-CoA transferase